METSNIPLFFTSTDFYNIVMKSNVRKTVKGIGCGGTIVMSLMFVNIVLFIFVNITSYHNKKEGKEVLSELKTSAASDFIRIEVYNEDTKEKIADIESSDLIDQFHSSLISVVKWKPNHPRFHFGYYVVLHENNKKYEFKMFMKERPDTTVYIYGVRSTKYSMAYLYRVKSNTLYDWFVANDLLSRGKIE